MSHNPGKAESRDQLEDPTAQSSLLARITRFVGLLLLVLSPLFINLWAHWDVEARVHSASLASADSPGLWFEKKDPWGNPWHPTRLLMDSPQWSIGPNGIDEEGRGDDIIVDYGILQPPLKFYVYKYMNALTFCSALACLSTSVCLRQVQTEDG